MSYLLPHDLQPTPILIPHLSFLCTFLPSSQITKLSHPSLSLHVSIMSYREVHHTTKTDCLAASLRSIPRLQVGPCMQLQLLVCLAINSLLPGSSLFVLKGIFNLLHSPVCKFTNWWICWTAQSTTCRLNTSRTTTSRSTTWRSTTYKYFFNFAQLQPPRSDNQDLQSAFLIPVYPSLIVHRYVHWPAIFRDTLNFAKALPGASSV